MSALKRIIKDRDHFVREVEEAKGKIEMHQQAAEALAQAIERHEQMIKEYTQIINLVSPPEEEGPF
ncbi:hypothetical protein V1498_06680 [Peribacillus sp. SCS-26]|uniref:hypothetical protein n=1 Tax=Paraperibacillus marinus TaxID=3115295 RepID=UPI003906721B